MRPAESKREHKVTSQPTPIRGNALLFMTVAVFGYGGLWPTMRLTVERMPALWSGATRLVVGSVFLFLLLAVTRRLARPDHRDLAAIISVGVFMMGAYVSLVHFALQFVPAGRGSLLGYTTPLWVAPAAILFLNERLSRLKLAGMVAGLTGLVVLFNPAGFDWTRRDTLIGNGLILLAAMLWSITILHLRHHRWHLSPLQLGPWQLLLASAIAIPAAWIVEGPFTANWDGNLAALTAYNGIIGTAIALWAATSAMRALPSVTVSVGLLGAPVIAICLSVALLGEAMTMTLGTGIVLVLAGLALVAVAQGRETFKG